MGAVEANQIIRRQISFDESGAVRTWHRGL